MLEGTKEFVNRFRFKGDMPVNGLGYEMEELFHDRTKQFFSHSGIEVSESLTPAISKVLNDVLIRLKVPVNAVDAFVFASSDIQAECVSGFNSKCFVRMSSSMVDLLSEEELCFVIGHEIGHFLFGHGQGGGQFENKQSIEGLMQSRAQEISADRAGLIATSSLEIGLRAMMKTISGLGDKHLRFDFGNFLAQLRTGDGVGQVGGHSTHPSLLMRSRALLWFSMSRVFNETTGKIGGESMGVLDDRVDRGLAKFVDGQMREELKQANEDLILWLSAVAAVRDGIFEKSEQELLIQLTSKETLSKLLGFLRGRAQDEVQSLTKGKLHAACASFQSLAPIEFTQKMPFGVEVVGKAFGQDDFMDYIRSIMVPSESNESP